VVYRSAQGPSCDGDWNALALVSEQLQELGHARAVHPVLRRNRLRIQVKITIAKPRVSMTACRVVLFIRPAENWQHRLLRLTPARHRATNGSLKVRIEHGGE